MQRNPLYLTIMKYYLRTILFASVFSISAVTAVEAQGGSEADKSFYRPSMDGALKTQFEISGYDGEYRFNVKNARIGLRGNASKSISYRLQTDLCKEGEYQFLDAYVKYHRNGLELDLGQQLYHLNLEIDRGPAVNMFANVSMLAKYMTSYYGFDGPGKGYTKTFSSRDMGATLSYTSQSGFPYKAYFGFFNGGGVNTPSWTNKGNILGRIELGRNRGFQGVASILYGNTPKHNVIVTEIDPVLPQLITQEMNVINGEFRYVGSRFTVESMYARRYLKNPNTGKNELLSSALLQTFYRIPMPVGQKTFENITPTLRCELVENVKYVNALTKTLDMFDAKQVTAGVNFEFRSSLPVRAEARINYEKTFFDERPTDLSINKQLHDKVFLELLVVF